jgi:hypothetical protein
MPALLMLGAVAVLDAIGCDGSDGSSAAACYFNLDCGGYYHRDCAGYSDRDTLTLIWLYDLFRSDLRTLRRRKLLRPG